MNILNLKRDDKGEITVKLSRIEVGYILNALYYSMNMGALYYSMNMGAQKGEALTTLHDEFLVVRDLLDYGHVDKFTAQTIAKRDI